MVKVGLQRPGGVKKDNLLLVRLLGRYSVQQEQESILRDVEESGEVLQDLVDEHGFWYGERGGIFLKKIVDFRLVDGGVAGLLVVDDSGFDFALDLVERS